jgi:hypothetical protein
MIAGDVVGGVGGLSEKQVMGRNPAFIHLGEAGFDFQAVGVLKRATC